jgi:cobalt-zinc-cadmium efflux system protein
VASPHLAALTTRLTSTRLRIAVAVTAVVLAVEVAFGLAAGSVALLADAGHILTDVIALALAAFAVAAARRPADENRTYGYQRVGILTALINGATLVIVVAAIAAGAVARLIDPQPVRGGLVIVAACIAIALNAGIALSLRHAGHDLTVRAAMLHVVGDLGASLGVVVAGVVIVATGWQRIDPLISLGIAVLIAWGALRIMLESGHILLEGTPAGLDVATVRTAIEDADHIDSVHDLHVWSLSSQQLALSCHIVVADSSPGAGEHAVRGLELLLCDRFGIGHTTIQVEACHPCDDADHGAAHGGGRHNHPHGAATR